MSEGLYTSYRCELSSNIPSDSVTVFSHVEFSIRMFLQDDGRCLLVACCVQCGEALRFDRFSDISPNPDAFEWSWGCFHKNGCGLISKPPSVHYKPAAKSPYCVIDNAELWLAVWLDLKVSDVEVEVSFE